MLSACQRRIRQLESCNREMFGDLVVTCPTPRNVSVPSSLPLVIKKSAPFRRSTSHDEPERWKNESDKRRASALLDQLLSDIYSKFDGTNSDYNSGTSHQSQRGFRIDEKELREKDTEELHLLIDFLKDRVLREGRSNLLRHLKRRDALRRQREAHCDVINDCLHKLAPEKQDMRFTIEPAPGDSGFSQWVSAMKMVAQLPGGIPPEFRRRLWLQLADRFLASKEVDWLRVERSCFSEWSHPADAELGVQIVKDLHRTGCSLFCGEDGQENQPLLKRVLLAYARWNKTVGYCQGFNMLAALILQVTEKNESDALKLMIYLIEGVLPDSYFADSLRGLSVDMAVFRELLKSKLPRLSKHLDALQTAAKEGTTSYEPPLTNVFTMQWFLTLFCNCLPQPTVLRVWDLILLEGNEMLLRTAIAIWQALADRILAVRSADEFYCIMGVLTREMLEFGLVEPNSLIKAIIAIGPLTELKVLREHYLYNINPWGPSFSQRSFGNPERQLKLYPKEKLMLDITALKKQYAKLKQRQQQAHIIFSAAVSRQVSPATPVAMNHLLLGKSALVPAKRLGPPKGAVPPARLSPTTLSMRDIARPPSSSSSSSSDTELCDEPNDACSDDESNGHAELLDDNLADFSDKNIDLIISDNTTRENSATDASQNADQPVLDSKPFDSEIVNANNQSVSDIFDTASTSDTKGILDYGDGGLVQSEDVDEDFDFDRFLEDRVRCLKQNSVSSEKSQEDDEETDDSYKASGSRRNSQRALKIIQENSLILHRILQCQSRLTSSSAAEENNAMQDCMLQTKGDVELADVSNGNELASCIEDDSIKFEVTRVANNVQENLFSHVLEGQPAVNNSFTSYESATYLAGEANAKFSISTDSHSAAEAFGLPAKSPETKSALDDSFYFQKQDRMEGIHLKENVSLQVEEIDGDKENISYSTLSNSRSDAVQTPPASKYSSILEYSKNLNEKYNTLILNSPVSNISKMPNCETGKSPEDSAISKSNSAESINVSSRLSSCESENRGPVDKSPTSAYNPFPVKLSSRQNKDVAVRLGLYKK